MMTYHDAEQFLLSLSNMPRREYMKDPKQCALYLKHLQFFLDLLGNPEKKIPHYIHVTGTSGKGSVCTFLQHILHAAGKHVGGITSPHPSWMTERWQIHTRTMGKKEFVRIVEEIRPALDEYIRRSPYDMISFPELMTAIGLLSCARHNVEWVVAEVGCGGRYCATNVIPNKDIAVITNIGLDHTEILGDTKEKIAYEKAGIIKKGTTVFSMEKNPSVLAVIDTECKKVGTTRMPFHADISEISMDISGTSFTYNNHSYTIPALGKHQAHNAALAIDIAHHLNIPQRAIHRGLARATQPLRMEVVANTPTIILDGAHNPDKIKTTVATITDLKKTFSKTKQSGRIHLVLGFSGNKDIGRMLKTLSSLTPATVACTRNTQNPFRQVADPKLIQKKITALSPQVQTNCFLTPHDALAWSKKQAKQNDLIVVTGSLFVSGELRSAL